ncbi:MAG: OadG family protein [Tenuifilaceae bacterium]|jgi:Na+-transporting methylmalonyl-CoA/oxaloacetate decarboxylase gamma subunit|nr:OadG family protein [Tenuifilaceae bacterium]
MNINPILLSAAQTNAAEEFVKLDPYGVGMTAMAMLVVLSVLAISAIVFQNIDNLIHFVTKLFAKRTPKDSEMEGEEKAEKVKSSGEEMAAIAMALHLFQSELHDQESLTLTINKISRTYSPWSSKIYGIMNKAVKRNPYS